MSLPEQALPDDPQPRTRFNVPNTFCAIRLVGSVVLVALVLLGYAVPFLAVFLFLAFTDWIDGKLAVWLDQRTTFGARLDSVADAAMYGALLFGCIWFQADVVRAEAPWIAAALVCYLVSCMTAVFKFGRLPSHHTYTAKAAWALTVLAAIALLSNWEVWPLRVAAVAVAVANLESTAITLLTNRWQADVPSVWCVLRKR